MMALEPSRQMWATFALIAGAIVLYATERFPLEQTSLGLLAALLLFHFAPLEISGIARVGETVRETGRMLDARALLAGFADPALIAVLALMVVGQGLIRTGALDEAIRIMTRRFQRSPALALGVEPTAFVHGVIFAANCSFATPMGYQTNLLVMGPGHYKFGDYLRGGAPLIVLIWLAFSLLAPWYYGI